MTGLISSSDGAEFCSKISVNYKISEKNIWSRELDVLGRLYALLRSGWYPVNLRHHTTGDYGSTTHVMFDW